MTYKRESVPRDSLSSPSNGWRPPILEATAVTGGRLNGAGDPADGSSLRGGPMLTTDNYECTWILYQSIPSPTNEGQIDV